MFRGFCFLFPLYAYALLHGVRLLYIVFFTVSASRYIVRFFHFSRKCYDFVTLPPPRISTPGKLIFAVLASDPAAIYRQLPQQLSVIDYTCDFRWAHFWAEYHSPFLGNHTARNFVVSEFQIAKVLCTNFLRSITKLIFKVSKLPIA